MTPRERFLAALNHEEPDRVPLDLGGINTSLMVGTYENLKNHLGLKEDPTQILSKIWQIAKTAEPILERLSIDSRYVFPEMKMPQVTENGDYFIDEWGVKRRFVMHYYDMETHPLGGAIDIEDIESYPWPEPGDIIVLEGLRERARSLKEDTDYAVCGYPGGGSLFEQAWYLRGYTDLLVDFMVNKNLAHAILTHVLDVRKKNAELFLKAAGEYLDVFLIGDDIASQDNPAMSPELYREMVKPYQAELFAFIKERTPAKLYYHSCGSVIPLIDDLIEIGVDALNPIQVTARGMDTAELKRRFGHRIAFWGAIDSQKVLPFGTPDDVRREVQRRIADLAPGGGYILAGVHNLQPDISPENIIAMYEEGAKFGIYPITQDAVTGKWIES